MSRGLPSSWRLNGADLLPGEHDRKPHRTLGPDHAVEPLELAAEDDAVQEQQGGEGLVLRRGAHSISGREAG